MHYRTKTYVAADWTGDRAAVEQLFKWNKNEYWSLSFVDAHELTQARDESLNCSIKSSLKARMDVSKTFILIIGNNTKNLKAGSCQYCNSYNSYIHSCARRRTIDYRSYIDYECEKAIEAKIKLVILYFAANVDKSKCPEPIRHLGKHVAMYTCTDGKWYWDYRAVKKAIEE